MVENFQRQKTMVALNLANIPTSINTMEKMHVWTGVILSELFPTLTAVEDVGSAVRVIQSSPYLVTAVTPPIWRIIHRTTIPLDPYWRRSSGGLWLSAQEIGTTPVPPEYLAS